MRLLLKAGAEAGIDLSKEVVAARKKFTKQMTKERNQFW